MKRDIKAFTTKAKAKKKPYSTSTDNDRMGIQDSIRESNNKKEAFQEMKKGKHASRGSRSGVHAMQVQAHPGNGYGIVPTQSTLWSEPDAGIRTKRTGASERTTKRLANDYVDFGAARPSQICQIACDSTYCMYAYEENSVRGKVELTLPVVIG